MRLPNLFIAIAIVLFTLPPSYAQDDSRGKEESRYFQGAEGIGYFQNLESYLEIGYYEDVNADFIKLGPEKERLFDPDEMRIPYVQKEPGELAIGRLTEGMEVGDGVEPNSFIFWAPEKPGQTSYYAIRFKAEEERRYTFRLKWMMESKFEKDMELILRYGEGEKDKLTKLTSKLGQGDVLPVEKGIDLKKGEYVEFITKIEEQQADWTPHLWFSLQEGREEVEEEEVEGEEGEQSTLQTIVLDNGRTWLAENLNVQVKGSYCYDDKKENCAQYGRLYTLEAAKQACTLLGDDWRLPTDNEWGEMIKAYGGSEQESYRALIKGGESGFDALLGGGRYTDGSFLGLGVIGGYWSATERDGGVAYNYGFLGYDESLYRDYYDRGVGLSVRCLQDQEPPALKTIALKDGKTWLAENLNVEVPSSYCYADKQENCDQYGRLYTWEAAKQACTLLGDDWRLPTDNEWGEMIKAYGGSEQESYRALIKGGESGFDALLGGSRYSGGSFLFLGAVGYYWSATESDGGNAYGFVFYGDNERLYRYDFGQGVGLSVRCLKD